MRSKSSATDMVSDADLAAEALIRERLASERPGDVMLGEEGGEAPLGDAGDAVDGVRWAVDPLDGTTNFLFGIPHWSVSIACADGDGPLAGVVHDPLAAETFAAGRGGRATLNGAALVREHRTELATALVGTGFAYERSWRERQAQIVARVIPRVRDIRRGGSAALDLAWTAAGRLDACYEHGLLPWDRDAGVLLCQGAGLQVAELPADDVLPEGLLAAPQELVGPLRELLSPQPA